MTGLNVRTVDWELARGWDDVHNLTWVPMRKVVPLTKVGSTGEGTRLRGRQQSQQRTFQKQSPWQILYKTDELVWL